MFSRGQRLLCAASHLLYEQTVQLEGINTTRKSKRMPSCLFLQASATLVYMVMAMFYTNFDRNCFPTIRVVG